MRVFNYVNNVNHADIIPNKHIFNTSLFSSTPAAPIPIKKLRNFSPFKKVQIKQEAKGLSTPRLVSKSELKTKSVETAQRLSPTAAKSLMSPVLANADSGATGTYLRIQDIQVLRNVKVSSQAD